MSIMSVLKCTSCDLLIKDIPASKGFNSYCPRCSSKVNQKSSLGFSGELALVIASLVLFFPAQFFSLITIDLFGVKISATVNNGSLSLIDTYPFVACLLIFC